MCHRYTACSINESWSYCRKHMQVSECCGSGHIRICSCVLRALELTTNLRETLWWCTQCIVQQQPVPPSIPAGNSWKSTWGRLSDDADRAQCNSNQCHQVSQLEILGNQSSSWIVREPQQFQSSIMMEKDGKHSQSFLSQLFLLNCTHWVLTTIS